MSIRTRLTLWYTSLLAISLLVFDGLLYSVLQGTLTSALDDRLTGEARTVITVIQAENDPLRALAQGRVRLPPIDLFASQYYLQIVNSDGETVQTSETLQGNSLPQPPGLVADIAAGRARADTVSAGRGLRLRIVSVPIILAGHSIGAVEVAQSVSEMEVSLAAIRRTVLLSSLALLVLAAVGGAILARAALRPIDAITQTARQITLAQDLGRRIPVSVPNDELGRLSGTINDMLARLETLFQAEQRLVADVSHELRTPLTTIRGNLDLLRRGAVEDASARIESLRAMEDEAARMSRLVNDLLLLAQADAGLKLYLQPVEMDTLLLDVYRQAQMMSQGAATVRLGGEDEALVMGDRDRLRQLLLNLVDNALKYTPAGGTVTLTLERHDRWVKVAVSDTGPGIAPEDLQHIFERFYRADRSRARPGGTGLGLSIAQWIAQAHGGRLEAQSEAGKGSVFSLWLPLADSEDEGGAATNGEVRPLLEVQGETTRALPSSS